MLTVLATAEALTGLAMTQLVRRLEHQGRTASLSDPEDDPESETGRVLPTQAQRSIQANAAPTCRRRCHSKSSSHYGLYAQVAQPNRRQLLERLDVVDRRTHPDAVGVLRGLLNDAQQPR
jgi:N-acetylmuramoyl-L-alanine amidase